jgi:hypothetical protein
MRVIAIDCATTAGEVAEMDILSFIASMFHALAWPAAAVVCVWMFKERLQGLLPLLHMKYGGFDVSFQLDQAERDAEKLPQPPKTLPPPTPEEQQRHDEVAQLDPVASIAGCRAEVETAMSALAQSAKLAVPNPFAMLNNTRLLRQHDLIDRETGLLLDDLRNISNSAMHPSAISGPVTADTAKRYRALADIAVRRLTILSAKAADKPVHTSN